MAKGGHFDKVLKQLREQDAESARLREEMYERWPHLREQEQGVTRIGPKGRWNYFIEKFGFGGSDEKQKKAKGGSVKPEADGGMSSLEYLRAAADSLANQVPFVSDETRAGISDDIKRPLGGFASQWMAPDDEGNPATSDLLNVISNPLVGGLAHLGAKAMGQRRTLAPPGLVTETLGLPADMMDLYGVFSGAEEEMDAPDISRAAQGQRNLLREGMMDELQLDEPSGIKEHLLESAGIMAGQVPMGGIPGIATKVPKLLKPVLAPVMAAAEWFAPTIDPKMANYAIGTGFGGALGATSEHFMNKQFEEQAGQLRQEVQDALEAGTIDLADSELILNRIEAELGTIAPPEEPEEEYVTGGKFAKGGAVRSPQRWLHGTRVEDPLTLDPEREATAPIFPRAIHLTQDEGRANFFAMAPKEEAQLGPFGMLKVPKRKKLVPGAQVQAYTPELRAIFQATTHKYTPEEARRIVSEAFADDDPDLAAAVLERLESRPLTGENILKFLAAPETWRRSNPDADAIRRQRDALWRKSERGVIGWREGQGETLYDQYVKLGKQLSTHAPYGMGVISALPARSLRHNLSNNDWTRAQRRLQRAGFDAAEYFDPMSPEFYETVTGEPLPKGPSRSLAVFDRDRLKPGFAKGGKVGGTLTSLRQKLANMIAPASVEGTGQEIVPVAPRERVDPSTGEPLDLPNTSISLDDITRQIATPAASAQAPGTVSRRDVLRGMRDLAGATMSPVDPLSMIDMDLSSLGKAVEAPSVVASVKKLNPSRLELATVLTDTWGNIFHGSDESAILHEADRFDRIEGGEEIAGALREWYRRLETDLPEGGYHNPANDPKDVDAALENLNEEMDLETRIQKFAHARGLLVNYDGWSKTGDMSFAEPPLTGMRPIVQEVIDHIASGQAGIDPKNASGLQKWLESLGEEVDSVFASHFLPGNSDGRLGFENLQKFGVEDESVLDFFDNLFEDVELPFMELGYWHNTDPKLRAEYDEVRQRLLKNPTEVDLARLEEINDEIMGDDWRLEAFLPGDQE